jgi:drug/metabolite transporter (DMT)-like permease
MKSASPVMNLQDWGLLVFLSILWGGSFMFIGIAVKELPPLVVVLVRVWMAASALLALHLTLLGPLPLDRRSIVSFAVMALINNVIPFIFFAYGQTMIAAGLAAVINATTPFFAVSTLAMAGEDRFLPHKVAGIATGVVGVAVLKGFDLQANSAQSLGILLCLLAAASYGLASLWAKKRLMQIPPLTIATGQLLCSTVYMTVIAFALDRPALLFEASAQAWLALVALAMLSTALAYVVYFRLVTHAGPANAQLVTMLVPVSAILLGYFVLAEALELREIAGAAIIIAALVIIDGRVLRLAGIRKNAA